MFSPPLSDLNIYIGHPSSISNIDLNILNLENTSDFSFIKRIQVIWVKSSINTRKYLLPTRLGTGMGHRSTRTLHRFFHFRYQWRPLVYCHHYHRHHLHRHNYYHHCYCQQQQLSNILHPQSSFSYAKTNLNKIASVSRYRAHEEHVVSITLYCLIFKLKLNNYIKLKAM